VIVVLGLQAKSVTLTFTCLIRFSKGCLTWKMQCIKREPTKRAASDGSQQADGKPVDAHFMQP
jgi:hypothetical protein